MSKRCRVCPSRSLMVATVLSAVVPVAAAADYPRAHVLIVANTAKRAWPNGGDQEAAMDRDRIARLIRENVSKEQLVLRVLPESEVMPEGILAAIDRWPERVAPGDAFLFYYTGHGNYDLQKQKFFFRTLGTEGPDDFHDLYRAQVEERLKRKSPKNLIILTDCCSDYQTPSKLPYQDLASKGNAEGTSQLFHYLLFEHTGATDLTSSKPGQVSGVILGSGSLFSLALVEVLNKNADTPLTWKAILQVVSVRVDEMFKKGYPDGAPDDESQHTQTVTPIKVGRGPVFGARGEEFRGMIVVTQVIRGTPADDAKIVRGDVILEINGQAVASQHEYSDKVDQSPVQMAVKLRRRSDRVETVTVTLDRP
jgi:hypothetical protein